jgi:hypothetical protein
MPLNRVAAAAGIGSVLISFVEFFGPSFPLTSDPAASVARHFVEHRTWTLETVAVQGVDAVLWVVFVSGLVVAIARSGAPSALGAAVVTGAGALLNTAISLTGLAAIAAAAYRVAITGPATEADGYFVFAAMTLVLSNFMLAVMAIGVACSRLSTWFRVASAASAVLYVTGGFALADSGAFSPDGALQFATYGVELAWTVAASVVLLRRPRTSTAAVAVEPSPGVAAGVGDGGSQWADF